MCFRPSEVSGITCPSCGANNTAGKEKCAYCGADLTAVDSAAPAPGAPAAPAAPGAPGAPAAPGAPKPPTA